MSTAGKELPKLTKIGKYTIQGKLGRGAFSYVYKVECSENKQIFAMKVMPKESLSNERDIERFQREVDTLAILKHENIVSLYDFFSDETNFYMVMDYCQNGELMNYIAKNKKLSEHVAVLIFQQLLNGVDYCHSCGVVHRDLKPHNILFDKFPHVKISDFGLCGFMAEDRKMTSFCGSPCYCAPECLMHQDYDGKKSDIWSLGVILYLMVTGDHPWKFGNFPQMLKQIVQCQYTIPKGVSKDCSDLITKILQKDPCARPSIEEINKHPFMNIVNTAKNKKSTLPPLPPTPAKKVSEIVAMSRSTSQCGDNDDVIISPFSKTMPINIPGMTKSDSMGSLVTRQSCSPSQNSSHSIVKPTTSISGKRQRSVENLKALRERSLSPNKY